MATHVDLIGFLQGREPATSKQIQQALGVSQASVSRLLAQAGDEVVRLGGGRSTRYGRVLLLPDGSRAATLFDVDERGVATELGELRKLASGQYLLDGPALPRWLLGSSGTGLFPSLPYFLDDMRPSGFLGRLVARAVATEWGFSENPSSWGEQHVARYLLERGHDEPGNLVLGQAALERAERSRPPVVEDRATSYPELALQVLGDKPVGSSAAGEQPKFLVWSKQAGHVIVKFSPSGSGAEARRWRDLLRAEARAQHALGAMGLPAAAASIHEHAGRVFLESPRFDRKGARGRLPSLSLAIVDAEFTGVGQGWTRTAEALHARGVLDDTSVQQLRQAELFGAWIGNTDMHLGNVSLRPGPLGFTLLPLYDMLPMTLAPNRGELPTPAFKPPVRPARHPDLWEVTGMAAERYWQAVADDDALDRGLRRQAVERARRIKELIA